MHAPATLEAIEWRRAEERRRAMATALHSFIKENGRVIVSHTFYGKTEGEAEKWKKHHLESCEYYRAAEKEGRTLEVTEELDELPDPTQQGVEFFLFGDEEDEELEEDDEELEEDETEEDEEED